jgi:hemerythrin superfamily protein
MAPDVVTSIKNDHRLLEGLFAQLQAGKGDRAALVTEVAARLTAHSRAEEEEVYPAIKNVARDKQRDVDHAYEEHQEAEHLLRKVENLIGSPHFDEALEEFVAAVKHHVEEEESQVLPALEKAVDAGALRRLGETFEQSRAEELRRAGYDEPGDADAIAPDLHNATRDELYALARQADIPGRSSMNKEELARALNEQR